MGPEERGGGVGDCPPETGTCGPRWGLGLCAPFAVFQALWAVVYLERADAQAGRYSKDCQRGKAEWQRSFPSSGGEDSLGGGSTGKQGARGRGGREDFGRVETGRGDNSDGQSERRVGNAEAGLEVAWGYGGESCAMAVVAGELRVGRG